MKGLIEYRANNSGGRWWLSEKNWKALEGAGWIVHWIHDPDDPSHAHSEEPDRRLPGSHHHGFTDPLVPAAWNGEEWLGTPAKSAAKECDDPQAAVSEWAEVTGKDASAEGCNCCGAPHSFEYTDAKGETHYTSVEVTKTELRWS